MATKTKTKAKPPAKKPAAKKSKGKAKAEPALSKWQEPEYLAAYDSETMQAVTRKNHEIYRVKEEWEVAHSKAERLKKELKEKTEERELYMRERDTLRGKKPGNLFADAEYDETLKAGKRKLEEVKKANQVNTGEPGGKTVLSGWFPENIHQRYPLAEWKKYGLQDKDVKALLDCQCKTGGPFGPIDTVGRLQEYQTPQSNGWQRHLNDLKGIGPAGVQRIEDAGIRFWSDWSKGLAEEFAKQCGYTPPPADPAKADAKKPKGKASANGKTKPGTPGGAGKAHGKRAGGKPRSAGRKPSASKVAEKLINDLAAAATIPEPAAEPGTADQGDAGPPVGAEVQE